MMSRPGRMMRLLNVESLPKDDFNNIISQDDHDEISTDSGEDQTNTSWISWFCNLKGNELFCEVERNYILDSFNLIKLPQYFNSFQHALDIILDVNNPHYDNLTDQQKELLNKDAEKLYGLIHARYIVSNKGMAAMLEKYERKDLGLCPRVGCSNQACLPVGESDVPCQSNVRIYCPKCEDIYYAKSRHQGCIDGAYFGTTFPHLFLMTYPNVKTREPMQRYVPKIFGFRIHKDEQASEQS